MGNRKKFLPAADRVRLAEAFSLARSLGDGLWTGWSAIPFSVLLLTEADEFLLRHPHPPPGFEKHDFDPLLGTQVHIRPRQYPQNLAACFPFAAVPTVVIGQPHALGYDSTRWVLTILHEHFHQLQDSQRDYYERVAALGLARGDETGRWMLDYPFPYSSDRVGNVLREMGQVLRTALREVGAPGSLRELAAYGKAQAELRAALSEADYRYAAFVIWQEGIAQYTEHRLAALAAERHRPTDSFGALPDCKPYAEEACQLDQTLFADLEGLDAAERGRLAFYPLGAAMGLMLDAAVPRWRDRYFQEMFSLEPLLLGRSP